MGLRPTNTSILSDSPLASCEDELVRTLTDIYNHLFKVSYLILNSVVSRLRTCRHAFKGEYFVMSYASVLVLYSYLRGCRILTIRSFSSANTIAICISLNIRLSKSHDANEILSELALLVAVISRSLRMSTS